MSDEQSLAKGAPCAVGDERPTKPPPSSVVMSRAERKKDWSRLVTSASEATLKGASLDGVQEKARHLTRHVGHLALESFSQSLVPEAARSGILDAASARFFRRAALDPTSELDQERLFLHAVRHEVVAWIWGNFSAAPRPRAPGEVDPAAGAAAALERAWREVLRLPHLQQRVLLLSLTLDSITPCLGDDRRKAKSPRFFVGLALGLRENSVHQHGARIRKKLFPAGGAGAWGDASEALRCLWTPSFKLARAALAYVEGYREVARPGAPEVLGSSCVEYGRQIRASREASAHARQAWREVVTALDASGIQPGEVHTALVAHCRALGVDDRVGKRWRPGAGDASGKAQRWADLLPDGGSCRPDGPRREAWRRFLQRHLPSAADVHERFEAFAARSHLADRAREAKMEASKALFDAATLCETMSTMTELLDLVSEAQATLDRG